MSSLDYSSARNHSGPVSAVARRGDMVYSGSYDGCLGLWRPRAGGLALGKLLYLHDKGVNCVAASPTGAELATGGSDATACIVIPEAGRAKVMRCAHLVDVECVLFSADGRLLLSGGTDGFGRIFEVATGRQVTAVPHGKTVGAACRHPDPTLLVTGCNDRRLRLVRWKDGKVVAASDAHLGPVKAVAVCASGILSAGHDQRLLLHDFALGNPRELARFSTTPKSIAAEPDGGAAWVGVYDQRLLRYTFRGDEPRVDFEITSPRMWAHGLAADIERAFVGSFDGVPLTYAAHAGRDEPPLQAPRAEVPCISTAKPDDSGSLLVAGDSGRIYSASLTSKVRLLVGSVEGAVTSMAGARHDLVVGSWDGVVARLRGGREVWRARWPASMGNKARAAAPVMSVSRSAGRVLAGLYTHGWVCFQEEDGEPLWHVKEATGAVKSTDLRAGVYAVTGRYDPLRVGDAVTGEVRARLDLLTPVSDVVSISPFPSTAHARIAVCGGANEVWVADLHEEGGGWTLRVVHRSGGHRLPIKALLWVSEDTVLAGDYGGCVTEHRLDRPAKPLTKVPCRLGISSLSAGARDRVFYTTFDGEVGTLMKTYFSKHHAA